VSDTLQVEALQVANKGVTDGVPTVSPTKVSDTLQVEAHAGGQPAAV
jgi:hypothetical protein